MSRQFRFIGSFLLSVIMVVMMVGVGYIHYACHCCQEKHQCQGCCSADNGQEALRPTDAGCVTFVLTHTDLPTLTPDYAGVVSPVCFDLLPVFQLFESSSSSLLHAMRRAELSDWGICWPRAYLNRICVLLI